MKLMSQCNRWQRQHSRTWTSNNKLKRINNFCQNSAMLIMIPWTIWMKTSWKILKSLIVKVPVNELIYRAVSEIIIEYVHTIDNVFIEKKQNYSNIWEKIILNSQNLKQFKLQSNRICRIYPVTVVDIIHVIWE